MSDDRRFPCLDPGCAGEVACRPDTDFGVYEWQCTVCEMPVQATGVVLIAQSVIKRLRTDLEERDRTVAQLSATLARVTDENAAIAELADLFGLPLERREPSSIVACAKEALRQLRKDRT